MSKLDEARQPSTLQPGTKLIYERRDGLLMKGLVHRVTPTQALVRYANSGGETRLRREYLKPDEALQEIGDRDTWGRWYLLTDEWQQKYLRQNLVCRVLNVTTSEKLNKYSNATLNKIWELVESDTLSGP